MDWYKLDLRSFGVDVGDPATSLYPCRQPQLLAIMDRYKLDLVTAGRNFNKIRMAIASGFFFHAARKDAQVQSQSLNAPAPPPACTPRQSLVALALAASECFAPAQDLGHQVPMISQVLPCCSIRMLS